MICLGIETSCDETALALASEQEILAETLASQAGLHAVFGGVVPELASREHYRHIGILFDELMRRARIVPQDIASVAVARGPGLQGSLLVGVAFAKALALGWGKPVLAINHLHAHLLAAGMIQPLVFPAIGLLVSGGHTQLYRIDSPDSFTLLGKTLDDAAGEAFDKIGNELGFSYPAGRTVNEYAKAGASGKFTLPRPYLDNDNMDYSFSGLKTAAIEIIRKERQKGALTEEFLQNFCREVNQAVSDTLLQKAKRALRVNEDVKSLCLAGGVAANTRIRAAMAGLASNSGLAFFCPDLNYCTDNAAMIAHAGALLSNLGYYSDLTFETVPRGKKIPHDLRKMPFFQK